METNYVVFFLHAVHTLIVNVKPTLYFWDLSQWVVMTHHPFYSFLDLTWYCSVKEFCAFVLWISFSCNVFVCFAVRGMLAS